ncbi:MAG: SxtJ family membrane protein [Deltaproteobacteria bacterium]|nr:SxtJ family membrane protein [Deltaproteobacteria bacterium]
MAQKKPDSTKIISRLLSATLEQAKDTGMAMVLICLLLGYFGKFPKFLGVSIVLLLITMAWPRAFKPLAGLWFGLSQVMGLVVSKILLSLAFFLVVTPIGLIRRRWGKDSLRLKEWKQGSGSVFLERQGAIQDKDLLNPY